MPAPNARSTRKVRGPAGGHSEKSGLSWSSAAEVGQEKTLVAQIFFQTNDQTLDHDDTKALQRLVDVFKPLIDAGETFCLQFEGHADKRYHEDYNQTLSEGRARGVHSFMVGKIPAVKDAFVIGYGERYAGGDLAHDRRVDVFVSRIVRATYLLVTVVDSNGHPVKDASVKVTGRSEEFRTNANGAAKIASINSKKVRVAAWKAEYSEEDCFVDMKPGVENRCKVTLRTQIPADLPVRVTDHRRRPIEGATVTAEPVFKTYGSYKTLSGATDNLGERYFVKIRHNTYKISATKDNARSAIKEIVVSTPGMNPVVSLTINTVVKAFHVCVSSARWYKVSKPSWPPWKIVPGIGILGLDVDFTIQDEETGRDATYSASATGLEITWGSPWSAGQTTGAGKPRDFEAKRQEHPDERTFAGLTPVKAYSSGGNMKFDLELRGKSVGGVPILVGINVHGIEVGPNTDPTIGFEWTAGVIDLVLK